MNLMCNEVAAGEEGKVEKDYKKLLTIVKSKFYMLKVNFPKEFESIDYEIADGKSDEKEE